MLLTSDKPDANCESGRGLLDLTLVRRIIFLTISGSYFKGCLLSLPLRVRFPAPTATSTSASTSATPLVPTLNNSLAKLLTAIVDSFTDANERDEALLEALLFTLLS